MRLIKIPEPLNLSEKGPLLVHAHANGYPPQVYRAFLRSFLDQYQVRAVFLRPFWVESDPETFTDWRIFRDDYLEALPSYLPEGGDQQTLIGMGHSVGAMATLMAAIENPNKFQALVLIEPTLFPPWLGFLFRSLAGFRLFRRIHPLIRQTLRRKTCFPDQESMYLNYRKKGVFASLPDAVLHDYVSGLAATNVDGTVSLRYSPAWEARIYETGGSADRYVWKNLSRVNCPVLILRGENSDTLNQRTMERIVWILPEGQGVIIPSTGHLAPLEEPEKTAGVILEFLDLVL